MICEPFSIERDKERLPLEDRCLVKAYTRDVEPHKGKERRKRSVYLFFIRVRREWVSL